MKGLLMVCRRLWSWLLNMAEDDFMPLSDMIYSGRGITVGMTPEGNSFIGYTLTGRSLSSQARELVYDAENQVIRTSVTDKKQLEKGSPALLIYPAIAFGGGGLVASNGAQTRLIYSESRKFSTPSRALSNAFEFPSFDYDAKEGWIDITNFEPDAPNNTPRINAFLREDEAAMHIARKLHPSGRDSFACNFRSNPGEGRLITTYKGGNEKPLLPFDSEPLEVKVGSNNIGQIVGSLYEAIEGGQNQGDDYRVAAAVMMLRDGEPEVAIRNKSDLVI